MKQYTISRVHSDPDWSAVPVLSIEQPYLQTPETVRAWAQLGHTDDALLVHLWAQVPALRTVETGPLGMPCEDSCLEFFFRPEAEDPRYLNFEFNPNGCLYLGIGSSLSDLTRLVPDDAQSLFCPEIRTVEGGWEIVYRIPYSFICRFFPAFAPRQSIRANCFACSDLTEPAYYLSWNPIEGEPFTFHRAESFGYMNFE